MNAPLQNSDRFLERAERAARSLLRCWIEYGPKQANELDPACFPGAQIPVAEGVLDAMLNHKCRKLGDVIAYFNDAPDGVRMEFHECKEVDFPPSPNGCGPLIATIRHYDRERRQDGLAGRLQLAISKGDPTAEIMREFAALEAGTESTALAATLAERAFDFDSHPAKPVPIFTLAEMPLCTAGNITNIQAPPKAGKSALVESMIAAVMNGNRQGPDTLGFSAENTQGHALIHFDTEQSRFDADSLIRRACRRVRVERPPAWFQSYSLADLDIYQRREALRHVMREAEKTHGGIFAVMVDGIGDICADPNDSEESFDLVHELHTLAIRHHCTIATVLHENPGSESGKTRGHLGSQLERKAETNLRLAKDKDGVTTIWAERARHCYLPKESGPCFSWNEAERMHTSCGTSGEIKSAANREKAQADAEKSFGDVGSFRHGDLLEAVSDALEIKERAAKDRVRKWAAEGIIRKDATGKYHITNP